MQTFQFFRLAEVMATDKEGLKVNLLCFSDTIAKQVKYKDIKHTQ